MFNSYQSNTLQYNLEKCINCGMCTAVCPHAVFAPGDKTAMLVDTEACMECGACQMNCPTDAITVESGVGCAYAMFYAAITGKKEPICCGTSEDPCC